MPVFLIGFMGSGKSNIGKMVADKLGYTFLDLDTYIENKVNKRISEIFKDEGEQHFRILEQEALKEFIDQQNIIVATGGGCPCFSDNMELMNKYGETIYLKVHHGTLYLRLSNSKKNRPLIAELNDIELMESIVNLLPEREVYYSKAKFTLEILNEVPNELTEKIIYYLEHKNKLK